MTFAVTGPGVEGRRAASAGAGLSLATTFASTASRTGTVASFYVRDALDVVVGRADSDGCGGVRVYGKEALDRAPDGPRTDEPSGGRPGTSHADANPAPVREGDRDGSGPRGGSRTRTPKKKEADMSKKESGETAAEALAGEVSRVTAKQAAERVLRRADGPLHVSEIVKGVMKTRGVELRGATPAATIQAMLVTENKKPDGIFVRVDKGTFALRERAAAGKQQKAQRERAGASAA